MADQSSVRIDVAEAKAKLESGEALALDVVQPRSWEEIDGAVQGAVRIAPQEIGQRFGELPLDLEIITYCT